MELLKELTQAWGVSGHEKQVREIIRRARLHPMRMRSRPTRWAT